jgi:hypothetical protein
MNDELDRFSDDGNPNSEPFWDLPLPELPEALPIPDWDMTRPLPEVPMFQPELPELPPNNPEE